MGVSVLRSLFACKAWADDELLHSLAAIPPAQAASLKTCIRTMNHIYVVDQIFKAHLLGKPHRFTATNTAETPSLEDLHRAMRATDEWFVSYLQDATPQRPSRSVRFQFTDGDEGLMTEEEVLMHLATHGAYHRGNVGQVLKSISVAPPRDLFTRFLHQSGSPSSTPRPAR